MEITRRELEFWLRESDPEKLRELWTLADQVRREQTGDGVHFRALFELSNYCRRNCLYCGIRAGHGSVLRYRATREEVLAAAEEAAGLHYGTLVLQSGEDLNLTSDFIADLIKEVKTRFGLAVTLSLGERSPEEWRVWKEAGADRYLLRFETSNPVLFRAIHPAVPGVAQVDRCEQLRLLRSLGYEIGSGVMVGLPGQSIMDLVRDLQLFRELDLDMIGCGPYLPHPDTPLGQSNLEPVRATYPLPCTDDPVANTNEMAFKVIALARLVRPDANIPSTTAIATQDAEHGRINGLSRGANVIMPNFTPRRYRELYEIYPHKSATGEDARQTHAKALEQVTAAGRFMSTGPGNRGDFLTATESSRTPE
ncbi:MAG: [FeFe] hydrogenase H-cluster radical SAM maturase HydE [Planctomycetia bacterium]|nr:[FeFe] hydrogenase H-cluster radical SAM maturase HydE [Planctomycetia bacterium]